MAPGQIDFELQVVRTVILYYGTMAGCADEKKNNKFYTMVQKNQKNMIACRWGQEGAKIYVCMWALEIVGFSG